MKISIEILNFLAISSTIVSSDFPPACLQMLDKNLFLFDCCEYPVIPHIASPYNKCMDSCKAFDFCCFQECSARESGAFVDDSLNIQRMKELFALQKGIVKYSNLTEDWREIVNKSVMKCGTNEKSAEQRVCEYIYETMACIFKENFLNCPNMKDKTECKEIIVDMTECSKNEGSWRFITDAFNTVKPRTYAQRYGETMN